MIKKCWVWLLRLLVVWGLISFLYRPWQEVLPVELVLLYFWLTSDELALKWLGRYVFLVELAYLFVFPILTWYYVLQNNVFWIFAIVILWVQIFVRLWRSYYKK